MTVKNKTQMYDLYKRGLFGNTLRVWDVDEFMLNDYHGECGLRSRVIGGACETGYDRYGIVSILMELFDAGYSKNDFIVCEGLDETKRVIQGEVCRSENHYDLTYTTVKKTMRDAFREKQEYATGLTAKMLLQTAMDPNSFADIMDLLDIYDGAVVEFTVNSNDVGIIPHRNTVVWEVRNY